MKLSEQTLFLGIICAILIGAGINEQKHRHEIFQDYLLENQIFGSPEMLSPEGNIPLSLTRRLPWVQGWVREALAASESAVVVVRDNPISLHTNLVLKHLPKYYPKLSDQSRMMPVFSCLLRNEASHGMNKSCGDAGKACGPVQFHAPTYTSYRARMMKLGLVDHMGDRLDAEDAIETMIYMFSIGQGRQWGPYSRGECK